MQRKAIYAQMCKASFIFALVLVSLLTSCTSVFLGLYGMKKPKLLTNEQLKKEAYHQGIPLQQLYSIDTSYWSYLAKVDTAKHQEVKNHSQPLQAMYFDANGQLFRYYVNCYAGGFPNLKWNRFGGLNQFPPLPQAPEDSLLPFTQLAAFAKPLEEAQDFIQSDTTIVVFWNRMMGRQSKRFIKLINRNAQLSNTPIQLLFVNTDDLFLDIMAE
jgi:hypothetical protein